jgi:hypothetical protein
MAAKPSDRLDRLASAEVVEIRPALRCGVAA